MRRLFGHVGSLGGAFLASVCWIGPTLAVALGIAGFGALTSLADYRPYFLGIAFAALGYSHWMAYRQRRAARRRGEIRRRLGPPERWLWATTGLVLLLAAFPYINPFVVR